jgi:Ca2+-binding RTX toxin-like protein
MSVRHTQSDRMRRGVATLLVLVAVAAVLAIAGAPHASAATIEWDGDWLVYLAEPGEANELTVQPPPLDCVLGEVACVVVADPAGITEIPDDCDFEYLNDDGFVDCPEPAGVVVELGDRDDSFELWEGDSDVYGGSGDDKLSGYGGDDYLDGEDGDDQLSGWAGDDTINGGSGNDELEVDATVEGEPPASAGRDVLDGGPGWERLSYALSRQPVSLTLDGVANDGAAGEGDSLAGIEELEGGTADDMLVGDDGPNRLDGSLGDDRLEARGGNDVLDGSAGDDRLLADAGDDQLVGDGGDDELEGGPGADQFLGDARNCTIWSCRGGNDQIQARDGTADSIDCGIGADHAVVDVLDTLTGDPLRACESVDRPPQPPPPPPPPPPAPSARIPTTVSLTRALASGIPIQVRCPARCRASATARAGKSIARRLRLGRQATRVAGGAKTLEGAGSATLVLQPTAKAKRRLRRARRVKLAISVTLTDGAGKTTGAGGSLTLVRRGR